jgi:predicted component of type VI protein secretion system
MTAQLVPLPSNPTPPIALQRPVLLVGRHPECDVRIDLPQVSRRHCCLALAYDRATIRDLGSRHGVRVNGRIIDEARLHPGDEIAIGHLLYRFEDEPPAPPPKSAAKKPRPEPRADVSLPQLDVNLRDFNEDDLIALDDD